MYVFENGMRKNELEMSRACYDKMCVLRKY